jgi:hypothetical protein
MLALGLRGLTEMPLGRELPVLLAQTRTSNLADCLQIAFFESELVTGPDVDHLVSADRLKEVIGTDFRGRVGDQWSATNSAYGLSIICGAARSDHMVGHTTF